MKVECVPLTSFVHGSLSVTEGRAVPIEENAARELERAGLVRIRTSPVVKKKGEDPGKGQGDGTEQQSSASPAGQASSTTTSEPSKSGKSGTRKGTAS